MGTIVYQAVCPFIGKFALFFMVIPAAIIGSAYLIGIVCLTLKEWLKN